MRCTITRFLRIRNLLVLTIIVILLYLVKVINNLNDSNYLDKLSNQKSEDEVMFVHGHVERSHFVPVSRRKIDWHNYTQIEEDRKRVGVGEHGISAHMPKSDATLEKELYDVNGFNGALSDLISLNRSVADIRHPACRTRRYMESLPTVSVVVPFHNEHWSTLLRTAHSVLYRSPPHLIKEIFLVDDASTKDFLKDKLDEYVSRVPKLHVLRVPKRSGLITARLLGARHATADVLLFLDSHTEANVNWLPPLLEPIAEDYRTAVCPFIDVIDHSTFEYRAQDEGARGAFDWELFYKRLPVLPKDLQNMPEPFESPVMAGGLFAISRDFFWELGGYDPGLDIWGGEQYELSFKIWQCGGRMVDAPCSRVGHIYRKFAPFPNPNHGDFVGKNYRRVAEVWMDEYAKYLYARRPHYRRIDPGDISEQKALRERLHCKSFHWFMTQIAFDLTAKYPPVEPEPYAEGRIISATQHDLCIDTNFGQEKSPLKIRTCDANPEQEFILSWHKDIRGKTRNICWDLPESSPKSPVLLYTCHLGGGNQLWRYDVLTKQIKHGKYAVNCIEHDNSSIYINKCSANDNQKWTIDTVNEKQMAKWDTTQLQVTGPVEVVDE